MEIYIIILLCLLACMLTFLSVVASAIAKGVARQHLVQRDLFILLQSIYELQYRKYKSQSVQVNRTAKDD